MAWQLHYTSVASGPAGRPGFQLIGRTPGTPHRLESLVVPLLTGKPPPTPGAARPVTLAYAAYGREVVLTRCHPLDRDRSGRHGDFFGHAVVTTPNELDGIRPIDFWDAPLWRSRSLNGTVDLRPGASFDPETLGRGLARRGEPGYALLIRLLREVRRALAAGYGRILLVSRNPDEIVFWIAVISYSLPCATAALLSFTTYSAEPAGTSQLLVGTTPDVRIPPTLNAVVIDLDRPAPGDPRAEQGAGRFIRSVAACWRRLDLTGIEAVGELDGDDLDTAAALLALCRGEVSVTPEEQLAVSRLLLRYGATAPGWVWQDLPLDRLEFDLALAACATAPPRHALRYTIRALWTAPDLVRLAETVHVCLAADSPPPVTEVENAAAALACLGAGDLSAAYDRMPPEGRDPLVAGVFTGLDRANSHIRRRMLTDEACRRLAGRDLRRAPRIGALILESLARGGSLDRRITTVSLLDLELTAAEADPILRRVWQDAVPTPADCAWLLESFGPWLAERPSLIGLFARMFAGADLDAPETTELAAAVENTLPGRDATGAGLVLTAPRIAGARLPGDAAPVLEEIERRGVHVPRELLDRVCAQAARRLTTMTPRSRTELLGLLSGRARARVVASWLAGAGQSRDERAALLEIAVRLRTAGRPEAELETWAQRLASRPFGLSQVEGPLIGDPELAAGLREVLSGGRRSMWRWR
ncbi:hypothetical protein [Rhizohabitans arisaemae]|uniref:GAP1-N2 domain-containing protein n=1 Tax=Rhizohabitans arisaemae TaxID=2720610 RepID=UPI0024B17A0A|nr:hypothetical protein [Rhizohabitans arisaemae]